MTAPLSDGEAEGLSTKTLDDTLRDIYMPGLIYMLNTPHPWLVYINSRRPWYWRLARFLFPGVL